MLRSTTFSTLLLSLVVVYSTGCFNRDETTAKQKSKPGPFSHLLKQEMSGFEKAVVLRRLIADTVDAGYTDDSLCLNFYRLSFDQFEPDSFFNRFAKNAGTAKCGLAGSILAKTLNNYGIEAYTYNYGFEGTPYTHVIVIARTNKDEWTIHDPFNNYSIVDSLGSPKDFFHLLKQLKNSNHEDIDLLSDTVIRDYHINSVIFDSFSDRCAEHLISSIGDSILVQRPVCTGCEPDIENCPKLNFFKNMSTMVNSLGYPEEALYGLLLQINQVWGPNPDKFQALLDQQFSDNSLTKTKISSEPTYEIRQTNSK